MDRAHAFTQQLDIAFPVIQAPMLGVSTPEMAAAVSEAGGMGSLALGGLSPQQSRELIRRTQSLTRKPFAVNLFVYDIPEYTEDMRGMRRYLAGMAAARGWSLPEEQPGAIRFYSYREQLPVLIEEGVRIMSFTFGYPDEESLSRLRAAGILLIGTATSVEEVQVLDQAGIDMIVVQGIEAGGHRGSFLDADLPQMGLISLLQTAGRITDKPLIAAGGIHDGAGMHAAFILGASAVQPGTIFINAQESMAIPSYKKLVESVSGTHTALTRAFSGRWARGITNLFMQEMDQRSGTIPPYPYQNSLTTPLRKMAQQQDDSNMTNLWAGQSIPNRWSGTTAEIFKRLVKDWQDICKKK